MWKCMMCETNNAENSECCIICRTKKTDAKNYYEKLNATEEPRNIINSASDSIEMLNTTKSEDTAKTESIETVSRSDSKDWLDSMERELKYEKEKIRLINPCGNTERGIMILLILLTIFLLIVLQGSVQSLLFALAVSIYVTVRGIAILNVKKWLCFMIKLLICIGICAIFGVIAIIFW